MGLFDIFKKKQSEGDSLALAEASFSKGDYLGSIESYQKVINTFFAEKEPKSYGHITKKIIECHRFLGNYERVIELWPSQYSSVDYGPKEMFELIKVLEAAQKFDLAEKIYESSGKTLLRNKVEFYIRQKKIPQAYGTINELLASVNENNPEIAKLWLVKAKLSMSLLKFPEANKYLDKILEKDSKNMEARKLKDFCSRNMNN